MIAGSIQASGKAWEKMNSKFVIFSLLAFFVFLLGSYVFFVNKTVMNVVAREKAEKQISDLASVIGEMEFKYMTVKNGITLDVAYTKGFKDAPVSAFLSRIPTPSTLSYNQ